MQVLQTLMPNVMERLPELWESCGATLYMMLVSGAISFGLGLVLGVVLTVTRRGGILQSPAVYNVLDKVINLLRSIPFVILIGTVSPVTRAIVGTAIGAKGAIVPLVFGTVPFFTRQIETALAELDHGLVEAAQSMGASPVQIVFRVYLRECVPGIVRATTITFISLVGLTAMAGAVGGGGLGDFAIRYGHNRNMPDVTYVVVILVLLLVTAIQAIGNLIVRRCTH